MKYLSLDCKVWIRCPSTVVSTFYSFISAMVFVRIICYSFARAVPTSEVCILVPCGLYFGLALPYYWSVPWQNWRGPGPACSAHTVGVTVTVSADLINYICFSYAVVIWYCMCARMHIYTTTAFTHAQANWMRGVASHADVASRYAKAKERERERGNKYINDQ